MIFLCILLAASSFLNGATDAANTVTGAVCSGILKPTSACALAAVMEALGNALSCALFPSVTMLISDMADLPQGFGGREEVCIAALCAVAVWSAAAWAAGLPTSEGHGLMAAAFMAAGAGPGEDFFALCTKSGASEKILHSLTLRLRFSARRTGRAEVCVRRHHGRISVKGSLRFAVRCCNGTGYALRRGQDRQKDGH